MECAFRRQAWCRVWRRSDLDEPCDHRVGRWILDSKIHECDSDAPRVISDYGIAEVPGTDGPIEEVCAPHLEYACPIDNATAFKKLGSPFIEYYSECTMPEDSSVKDRSDALSETTKAWLENKLPKKLEFASESPATPSMVGGALVGVVLLAFAFSGIVFSQRVDRETEVDVYHAYEGQGGCSTAEGVA
ncbi:unnamed protein product [Polarella glacialis]|uniref:Uncharacterized protein n=1 Tax=Polarella glacialis TaxID=89957 RepID=A0A813G8F6_POLGL|nr:unnamed protein product [Polarella glacialis]